jgi:hypothetical protein
MALRKFVPVLAVGAVAAALGVGGASLASAQDDPSTTTPPSSEEQQPATPDGSQPDSPQPDGARPDGRDGANCPKDGQGDGGSTPEGSSLTTT